MRADWAAVILNEGGRAHPRPQPVRQNPLPPWDASDNYWPYNQVHTTIPTGIPPVTERNFWRHDPWGVTIPSADVPPFNSSQDAKIAFAQSIGANTTPLEMIMSYLSPYYLQFGTRAIDAVLTAHAESGLRHFHLDRGKLINALGLQKGLDFVAYVQSWGFFTSFWLCGTGDDRSGGWPMLQPMIEPFLRGVISQGLAAKSIMLVGEELNSGCVPGAGTNGLDPMIDAICAICNPVDIPVWLHFTANVPAWPAPGQDQIEWIRQFAGRLTGLCWQGNPDDTAGTMGARLWDARWRWAQADPSLLVSAWELEGENLLYARVTREYAALRGLEMLNCPSGAPSPNAPMVAGAAAARREDGSAI